MSLVETPDSAREADDIAGALALPAGRR